MNTAPPDNDHACPVRRLRQIVARLRAPDGCPWDKEQTHASLRHDLIEEAYEVIDTIDRGDDAHLREELGDLLLQVVMHSQIASERGVFDLDAVARDVADKLVRRHPHVFGDKTVHDVGAVWKQWEEIKRTEKAGMESVLDGVANALPALVRAEKIQKKAARAGFDWPSPSGVIEKIREELAEVERELANGRREAIEAEIGDLLFAVVNLARQTKCDSELVLRQATEKFSRRFRAVEAAFKAEGRELGECSLAEMDAVWERVKAGEK